MKMLLYKTQLYILNRAWNFWHIKSRSFFENLWVKLKFVDRPYEAEFPKYIPCCNGNRGPTWQTNLCEYLECKAYEIKDKITTLDPS